jgi:hypothetical protein
VAGWLFGRLFGLREPSHSWCDYCDVPFGTGECDVCRLDRGEDPYKIDDEELW